MFVNPPTSTRVVMLECGARPTDRGWYTHQGVWPSAAAEEGNGQLWANVAADGRLRVFSGALASTRTLLHSTPVLGVVLSLLIWPERSLVITLEENDSLRTAKRCPRMIRFYSYAPGAAAVREVVELSAMELDQAPNTPVFAPSLMSMCTYSHTLALAHDHTIKIYNLSDIFIDEATHRQMERDGVNIVNANKVLDDYEPGAFLASPPAVGGGALSSSATLQSSSTMPTSTTGNRILLPTYPKTRRYLVKIFQILPEISLQVQTNGVWSTVRYLDWKQGYLAYGSFVEMRVVLVRMETKRGGGTGPQDNGAGLFGKIDEEPDWEKVSHSSSGSSGHSSTMHSSSSTSKTPQASPAASSAPFELLGSRTPVDDLRLTLRDDMYLRELILLLHRRFSSADQIHTIRLIPPVEARHDDTASNNGMTMQRSLSMNELPPLSRRSSYNFFPPSATAMTIGNGSNAGGGGASGIGSATPASSGVTSTKHELYALLSQGMPTGTMMSGANAQSHNIISSSSPGAAPTTLTSHNGTVVELLDDDEEDMQKRQILEVLEKLEGVEDEAEELEDGEEAMGEEEDDTRVVSGEGESSSATSPDTTSLTSSRTNGRSYLSMRFLLSTQEECHLYDLESDQKLVSYLFEHDLISLQVRGCYVIALTTHAIEIHLLWFGYPMMKYLTIPFCVERGDLKSTVEQQQQKIIDILVLDDCILLRPDLSRVESTSSSSKSSSSTSTPSDSPSLIVQTLDMDACEHWTTLRVKQIPSVEQVVTAVLLPLAMKSMPSGPSSSSDISSTSVRLLVESLMLLIQRYEFISGVLESEEIRKQVEEEEKQEHEEQVMDGTVAGSSLQQFIHSPGDDTDLHHATYLLQLRSELLSIHRTLSLVNYRLFSLFLTSYEIGLACHFVFYQQEETLEQVWKKMEGMMKQSSNSASSSSTSSSLHSHYLSKFLIHTLLRPSLTEQKLLSSSPTLISSILTHFHTHHPHMLGHLLLRTYLLFTPYDPRMILRILEENATKGNYDTSGNTSMTGTPGKTPRAGGGSGISGDVSNGAMTPYRVRPVVFHTFVQALMHLQLSGVSSSTVSSSGSSSGKDSASILLNSFSGHSLEYLLITHSALLTRWSYHTLLVDLLRASVPWSLLEVLVVLTQRGEIHVNDGITLLIGQAAASSVLAPTAGRNTVAAGNAGLGSPALTKASSLSSFNSSGSSITSPTSPSSSNPPSSPPPFSILVPLTQLQSYLECSLNPFMLTHEIGTILASEQHGLQVEPWDSAEDKKRGMEGAMMMMENKEESPSPSATCHNPHSRFIPLHVRENHRHNPHQIVMLGSGGPARSGGEGKSITREQVAALATQLACFYLQQPLDSTGASNHPPSTPSGSTSRSGIPSTPSSSATRRTSSLSMSHHMAPSMEFAIKHPLANWWHAKWIDGLRGMTSAVTSQGGSEEQQQGSQAQAVDPSILRLRRLYSILSSPLPLSRSHYLQIFSLLQTLPPDSPSPTAVPIKTSLLLLVLPRIGMLSHALRLVISHSPECMYPYAMIYCGEMMKVGGQHGKIPRAILPTSYTTSRLQHWQLLHAILLLHVFYTSHGREILQAHAPMLLPSGGDDAHSDETAARTLVQPLLSNDELIQPLLRPLDPSFTLTSSSFSTCMSSMSPHERASLYQQLYVFLIEQLVGHHTPEQFLTFIPQCGSARFYLPWIEQNFEKNNKEGTTKQSAVVAGSTRA